MNDSDNDNSPGTGQSSTQATNNSNRDTPDSKYVIGDSPITHIDNSLTAAAEAVDGPLTIASYEQWREQATQSHASTKQITHHSDRGDTWVEICGSLGIKTSRTYDCSTDAIREALHHAAQAVGEPLKRSEYDAWQQAQNKNFPTSSMIQKHIDKDWREICEEIGVQPHSGRKYTKSNIKTALKDAATDLGEPLILSAYQSWVRNQPDDRPSVSTITRMFENWVTACREAEVETHRKARYTSENPYTEAEIITAVQAAAEASSEPLSPGEYDTWRKSHHGDHPSKKTCLRRFDTWEKVCEKAGIQID